LDRDWVGPRDGLDVVEKRKIKLRPSSSWPVAIATEPSLLFVLLYKVANPGLPLRGQRKMRDAVRVEN
jgi:hypothetical protein